MFFLWQYCSLFPKSPSSMNPSDDDPPMAGNDEHGKGERVTKHILLWSKTHFWFDQKHIFSKQRYLLKQDTASKQANKQASKQQKNEARQGKARQGKAKQARKQSKASDVSGGILDSVHSGRKAIILNQKKQVFLIEQKPFCMSTGPLPWPMFPSKGPPWTHQNVCFWLRRMFFDPN